MGKWCGVPHEQPYLCGAYARSADRPCRQIAMKNGRCYLHGGKSTGANKSNIKHGLYSTSYLTEKKQIASLIKTSKQIIFG